MADGSPSSLLGAGLQIEQLVFSRDAQPIVSIDRFAMAPGEHALVTGPSGCGKTTLLSLIAGLLPIQHGRIELAGENLKAVAGRGLLRRCRCSRATCTAAGLDSVGQRLMT
jgi:putative ABC transport system ATP-binding protein